jgi:integrase
MRYGELLGLTLEDIDFDNQEIAINKSYDYHTNSGFKATKTYSSCRIGQVIVPGMRNPLSLSV